MCFVAGTEIETESGGRKIELLRVGERVLTTDGDSSTEVDPATWRKVTLRMPNPESPFDVLDLELLRSADWIAATGCQPGARMWFELDEMGLRGWADVQTVSECPSVRAGRGRLVLGTVTHYNTFVMEVWLVGQSVPLRPTDRHRLFSVTRNDWIPTSSLYPGEELRTAEGSVRISSVHPCSGAHRVCNIEVETEHSYFAGNAKVLSHNVNPCAQPAKPSLTSHKEALSTVYDEVGKLSKGKPGKFGSPQAGDKYKGYRLDPAHPESEFHPPGSAGTKPHFDWWDWPSGKRNGAGSRSGKVPVEE